MKQKRASIFISAIILSALGIIPFSASAAVNETPPELPTTAECVKKTGFTEEKCEGMMENFKNMKPGEGHNRPTETQGSENNRPIKRESPNQKGIISQERLKNEEVGIDIAKKIKAERKQDFSRIIERVEKIIEFLRSKNIDTAEAENDLSSFKEKVAIVSDEFDAYIAALENYSDDSTEVNKSVVSDCRERVREKIKITLNFYRTTLKENLKELIAEIQ
jgi:hypothetical protein